MPDPSDDPPRGELPAAALRRWTETDRLRFATTADLEPLEHAPGQQRAAAAVEFGLGLRRQGYNVFAVGPEGIGKRTVVHHFARRLAAAQPTPPDWVYVNNFEEPHRPRALSLPAGRGTELRRSVRDLIDELRVAISTSFESDDYRARRHTIDNEFKERHDRATREVEQQAAELDVGIMRTPLGLGLAPLRGGEVIGPDDLRKLPEADRQRIQKNMNLVHERLQKVLQDAPRWDSERREKIRRLNEEVIRFAIGHLLEGVRRRFAGLPNVVEHLGVIERDLVENAETFLAMRAAERDVPIEAAARRVLSDINPFDRYQVNLLVDRSGGVGAPVIEEDHPTYANLVGRVEYRSQLGTLVTDFTLIKPGALHRANGGYLVLDARRVLMQPFAWEELKRALRASRVEIRPAADMLGLMSSMTLQPEPIPLDLKIVLTGDRLLYYLLAAYDPDFQELFKIAADFEDETERTEDSEMAYARLIAGIARSEKIRPLERDAVARVIEYGARLAGDGERISARVETLADLMREGDHLAGADAGTVSARDIERAIDLRIHRQSRVRERLTEEIRRGTILVDTDGARVGVVNGLSVVQLGGFAFGHPSRISARVRLGKGDVIDIEREVELGGPIHSKGVLILGAYLGARYARERPLSLSASLVFEQSYGGVEGDSASLAELCALISALAGCPLRQDLAVTGSVSQNGEVQAIGGVNEKIEGFFDLCRVRGLTGAQGVIVPAANVKHLMLRREVVEAASAGQFHVYAVANADDALSILAGAPAGERDAAGEFPPGSVNRRAEDQVAVFAERARSYLAFERRERPA